MMSFVRSHMHVIMSKMLMKFCSRLDEELLLSTI